jgi:hypothetical protein
MSEQSGGPELLDPSARGDAVIAAAMAAPGQGGPVRWIAVAEAARRGDPEAKERLAAVGSEAFAASWEKLDGWKDTADFDLLYLLNLRLGYEDLLATELVEAIDRRILAFKYWYTDATPGVVDHRWYWSENHRIIFHTLELLAGQLFEDRTFAVPAEDGTPLTGADHERRASEMIDAWIREKAAHGFSEWHSDVYYQKDLTPLLTLAEFVEDPLIAARATAMVDLVLFDLALHQVAGNVGVTHGRSYAKDKLRAADQDTFGAVQVLFGTASSPASPDDAGAVLFARAQRYRMPSVLAEVARTTEVVADCEHMGVEIDPHEPVVDDPVRRDGLSYTDPSMVPFWWERSALTPWQTVALTMDTADRYGLWDTDLFSPFRVVQEVTGGDRDVARELAASFAPMINIGLLTEVDTCTWRSGGVMLSSAIDYRPGELGHQYHAWQATLGEDAVAFTTSPGNEPRPGERWPDSDLYWNGGVQPRSLQARLRATGARPAGRLRPPAPHPCLPPRRALRRAAPGGRLDLRPGRGALRGVVVPPPDDLARPPRRRHPHGRAHGALRPGGRGRCGQRLGRRGGSRRHRGSAFPRSSGRSLDGLRPVRRRVGGRHARGGAGATRCRRAGRRALGPLRVAGRR